MSESISRDATDSDIKHHQLRMKLINLRQSRSKLLDTVAEIDAEMREIRKELNPQKMQASDYFDEATKSVTAWDAPQGRRTTELSAQRPMLMLQAFNLGAADDPSTALQVSEAWIRPCFDMYFYESHQFFNGKQSRAPRIDDLLGLGNCTEPDAMPDAIEDYLRWMLERHLARNLAFFMTCFQTENCRKYTHKRACEIAAELQTSIAGANGQPIMGPWSANTIEKNVKWKYAIAHYTAEFSDMSIQEIRDEVNLLKASQETKTELNTYAHAPESTGQE